MKGPLRRTQSAPDLSLKKQVSDVPLRKRALSHKKPISVASLYGGSISVASQFLLRGKKYRRDGELPKEANELYNMAQKVNPNNRNLLEETNEMCFVAKIVKSKKENENKKKNKKKIRSE